MFPVLVPELRQGDNTNDRYNSTNNGEYRYQQLSNSSISSSESSLNLYENHDENLKTHFLEAGVRIAKSLSDQKLPEAQSQSYYYVNKNGHAVKTLVSPAQKEHAPIASDMNRMMVAPSGMLCNSFLVDLAKTNNSTDGYTQLKSAYESHKNPQSRNVPSSENGDLSRNDNSVNTSIVTEQVNGGVRINTNLAIDEPNVEITYDHVKYINIVAMLCCWCFPFTGIASIVYARLTSKYYTARDLTKAKFYLKRSEWMLIVTFFFGLTLFALGVAFFQDYVFSDMKIRHSSFFSGQSQFITHLPQFLNNK